MGSEIVIIWQLHIGCFSEVFLHGFDISLFNLNIAWGEYWCFDKGKLWLTTNKYLRVNIKVRDKLLIKSGFDFCAQIEAKTIRRLKIHDLLCESSQEPDEWLFELVIRFGRDIVVLKVLLSVENNLLGLNFSILDINLVSDKNNWDVFTNSDEILVPLWDVLIGDSGADIEHDDTAVSSDVVTISKTTKLFLTGGIPNIEANLTLGGEELHWVDLNTEGSNVFLFEFSGKMSLDESGLSNTTISYKHEFEFSDWSLFGFHFLPILF